MSAEEILRKYSEFSDIGITDAVKAMEEYKNQELKAVRDKITTKLNPDAWTSISAGRNQAYNDALEILDTYINTPVKKDI